MCVPILFSGFPFTFTVSRKQGTRSSTWPLIRK